MEGYNQYYAKIMTSFLLTSLLLLISSVENVDGRFHVRDGQNWRKAHATFYGGADASGTMGNTLLLPFNFLLLDHLLPSNLLILHHLILAILLFFDHLRNP